MLNVNNAAMNLRNVLLLASEEVGCQCDRLFFDNVNGDAHNYESGVCDVCNTLLIIPVGGEFNCPICDANEQLSIEVVNATDSAEICETVDRDQVCNIIGDTAYTPSYLKHYTWRERIVDPETGLMDLVAPHSDPEIYDEPIGFIFDSRDEALVGLDTHNVREEAIANRWVLLMVSVTDIEDPFRL